MEADTAPIGASALGIYRAQSEYRADRTRLCEFWERDRALRARLKARPALSGLCAPCRRLSEFSLPPQAHEDAFREGLACVGCGLNNRVRAAVALWLAWARPEESSRIYVSEQGSALHAWLRHRFPHSVGSEYLGAERAPGETVLHPSLGELRHEDLTRLSFEAASLEHLLCFDVLEHLPAYRPALAEFARVLAPEGFLVLTLPFDPEREEHEERARLDAEGRLEHLLPPLYHGDPLRPEEGILCYRTYGWRLLAELREAGFAEAFLALVWSPGHGHLGWPNLVLLARR
jgi:SAM-dependent methyltransferase